MKHFTDKAKARLSDLAKQAESLPSEPFTLGKYLKGTNARKTAESFLEYAKNAPNEGCFFYSCLHNIEQILKSVKRF